MTDSDNIAEQMAQVEAQCNCEDEYRTTPCPLHQKHVTAGTDGFGNGRIVITDDLYTGRGLVSWMGHTFYCPSCGEDAIMVRHNFCANCGLAIVIHSKVVTDHINKLGRSPM